MEDLRAMSFQIYYHGDIRHSKGLATLCREYSDGLQAEFPEAHKFQVSVSRVGGNAQI